MAEDLSFLTATNFESAYHLSQLAHPLLKASGAGNIILVSSVCGVLSTNLGTIYAATKGIRLQLNHICYRVNFRTKIKIWDELIILQTFFFIIFMTF